MIKKTTNGQRILIVDDDLDVLRICSRALENVGYTVLASSSAEQARQYIEHEDLQLAIIDIHMPNEDGISLLRYVHQLHPLLPTMLITGYPAAFNTVIESIRLRAQEFLCKPFTMQQLLEAVASSLDKSADPTHA